MGSTFKFVATSSVSDFWVASSQKPQTRTFKKVIFGFSKKNLSLIVQDEVYPGNVEAI